MVSEQQYRGGDSKPVVSVWPFWLKLVVSSVLTAHFGLIALVYFSNNSAHRAPLADQLLQKCQPYLIGMGWYTELLPMSLVGHETYDKPIGIDYKLESSSRIWTPWIDSTTSDRRWKRLGQLSGALAVNEDEEGLGLIALSLIKKARSEGLNIAQIRYTARDPETQSNLLLYQAVVVRLANGELTLVPELEPTRTVPISQNRAP
ncbi:MAG: hypothetical protein ACKOAU_11635 [Pirellula sp.]